MMNVRSFPLALLGALALCTTLPACDSDDGDGGGGADTGGSDLGGGDTGAQDLGSGDTDGSGDALIVNEDGFYRLTFGDIYQPAAIGSILSQLINREIRLFRLHIMVDMRNFDAAEGPASFEITGNAGEMLEDETYRWQADTTIEYRPATVDADGAFTNTAPLDLNFPAPVAGTNPPEFTLVPIHELYIEGTLAPNADGDNIELEGTLSGVIYQDEAETVEVVMTEGQPGTPLSELLGNTPMDYPAEGADAIGWRLEADIRAERVPRATE